MDKGFVIRAAGLLMVIQVLSRVLGYARDSVLQNFFGRSFVTDAFNAAFSIPDFIYNILIGGAISAAFIPVFSSYLAKGETRQAWRTSSIFSSWVLLLMIILLSLGYIFTEPLMGILTQYDASQMDLPVTLARITLIQALFMRSRPLLPASCSQNNTSPGRLSVFSCIMFASFFSVFCWSNRLNQCGLDMA